MPSLQDLLQLGVLSPGERLVWERPRLGISHEAQLTADGKLKLPDGRVYGTPSAAATAVSMVKAINGWMAWRAPNRGNRRLADLRAEGTHV